MQLPFAFTPVADFFSRETRSHYVAGMSYRVRVGNDYLATLVEKWLAEGKVVPFSGGLSVTGEARVKGNGTVS